VKLRYRTGLKWNWPDDHCVKTDSSGPKISLLTTITFSTQKLRCNISRGATLLKTCLGRLELSWHAKVSDLNFACCIDHNVFKFYVPMEDMLFMERIKTLKNLGEEILCLVFFESSPLLYVREQISPRAKFHYKTHVLTCLKWIKKLYYMLTSALLNELHLLQSTRFDIIRCIFFDRLYGYEGMCEFMKAERNFTKSASP